MMRSMFSGVAGLRTHQSKMDVIGNNIANVNTVGYKTQNVTFTDVFYQTVQAASGPNAETGKGGTNAKQIGIGSALGTIATNVSKQGGMQATDNPFDVMINGDEFFIVSDGQSNFFTKAGNFNVDEAGNLVNGSGLTVMGWGVNEDGDIMKERVSALKVMSGDKMFASPEKTTKAHMTGNLCEKDDDFLRKAPKDQYVSYTMEFYDSQGYLYNATFHITQTKNDKGEVTSYSAYLYDVIDQNGNLIAKAEEVEDTSGKRYEYLNKEEPIQFSFNNTTAQMEQTANGTKYQIAPGEILYFKQGSGDIGTTYTGEFKATLDIGALITKGVLENGGPKVDPAPTALRDHKIEIDFAELTNYGSDTSIECPRGDAGGYNRGKAAGKLSSLAIGEDGKIVGNYTNGDIITLGQIAVASFANPAGLEKLGNNLFGATMNSGSFDGIGKDITANGDSMTTGVLEMSNVDLAYEFTEMITTQRGFQANSRIITTSDTMLEELINLKR